MATSMSQSRSWKTNEQHNDTISFTRSNESIRQENTIHSFSSQMSDSLDNALRQFYRSRKVTVKNLKPKNFEDIKMLQGNGIEILEYDANLNKATLQLEDCENVNEVVINLTRSCDVTVVSSNTLLCIAHLQCDFSDQQLQHFVSSYGKVARCFMYRCPITGESLGYGFVEFDCSTEKCRQIQEELDWHHIDNYPVHCDVVELMSYDKLSSRCLLIDNLPKDFTDVMALRDIFSKFYSPLYCQIVMKGSESLGFGIIEYKTHEEAQKSKVKLDNHMVLDQPIRLTYCIPGKSGIFLCTRIITKFRSESDNTQKGLLPDPILPKESLMKTPLVKHLCQQNPELMTSFKQALDQLQQAYVNQMTGSSKPGLLGPPPSTTLNPFINPNMQLGLMILLAIQIQSSSQNKIIDPLDLLALVMNQQTKQDGRSALLSHPLAVKANVIINNLTSQLSTVKPLIPNLPGKRNLQHSSQHNPELQQSMALNLKNINMNLLINLGQLVTSLQNTSSGNVGTVPNQQCTAPSSILGTMPNQQSLQNTAAPSILGSAPKHQNMTSSTLQNIPEPQNTHSNLPGGVHDYQQLSTTGILGNVPRSQGQSASSSLLGNVPRSQGQSASSSLLGNMPEFQTQTTTSSILGRRPEPLIKNQNFTCENPNSMLDITTSGLGTRPDSYDGPSTCNSIVKENVHFQPRQEMDQYNRNMSKNSFPGVNRQQLNLYDNNSDITEKHYNRHVQSEEGYYTHRDDVKTMPLISNQHQSTPGYNQNSTHVNPLMANMNKTSGQYIPQNGNSEILTGNSISHPQDARNALLVNPKIDSSRQQGIVHQKPLLETDHRQSLLGIPNQDYDYSVFGKPSYNHQKSEGLMPPPVTMDKGLLPPPTNTSATYSSQVPGKYSHFINQSQSQVESSTTGMYPESFHSLPPIAGSKRNRSQACSLSDYSDSFTDPSSLFENSYRSNDSLFSDGGHSTPVILRDDGLLKTPIGQKRSYSHLLPAPEPSPDGEFIGQHSQGIGGHYADSYRKRPRLDREDLKLRY